jgi:dTDP-4-dehydrorhamnose reductase
LNAGVSPTRDRGFNEELRRVWEAGKSARLFVDEFRSPMAAIETVKAVWQLVQKNARGLYHVAGSEHLSRWRIGELLAARWPELNAKLEPASLKEYSGPPRAPDTSLNCTKAEALLGYRLPGFSSWLESHPQSDKEWML